jgi:hypothetical protein
LNSNSDIQQAAQIASRWVEVTFGVSAQVAACDFLEVPVSVLQQFGLDCRDKVYGVSFYCDWDTDAKGLPPYLVVFVDLARARVISSESGSNSEGFSQSSGP